MTRLALVLPVLLAACAQADKPALSDFTPEADGRWRFIAQSTGTSYPPDSASAEQTRLLWLQEDVIANRACPPNGAYRVTRRTVLQEGQTYIGIGLYRIVYDVECQ
jgi:hypothetical protein